MGSPLEDFPKKKKAFLSLLLLFYLALSIGNILKISVPNSEIYESIDKYIDYFRYNSSYIKNNKTYYFNEEKDEDFIKLNDTKASFGYCFYINALSNIVLLTIDFIILVFACWGLASGMETSGYCCIICTTLGCEECFTCIVKAALTCPLLLQFLIGLANVWVILGIILGYHIAKSSINSLKEKLNIDRINIDLINNQIFDILFLVAFFLITVLTIVYWCLYKTCYKDSAIANPPKNDFQIINKKPEENELKEYFMIIIIENNI